jgi:predicted HTH transcriptional regulator
VKRKQVEELIEAGENITCEFKRKFSTPEKIAKEMIALANTKGGYILFGVDDNKEIIGVESEKGEAELIKDAALNFCEPAINYKIEYVNFEHKEIVVIHIPESKVKPHRIQDYLSDLDVTKASVYIRIGEKSVQASKEMIKILRAQTKGMELKKYKIGDNERTVFNYLQKNETISVKELSSLVNISERRASRTLINLVRANLLMIHSKDNGEQYFTGI